MKSSIVSRAASAALADADPKAGGFERLAQPPPCTRGFGSSDGDADLGDAGGDDGVGAGRGAAVVAAGLEGGVERGAAGKLAGLAQRDDLGVRAAGGWV